MDNRPKSCNRVTTTTSKHHPIRKPSAFPPLAPSVTAAPCQLPPGGSCGESPQTISHGNLLQIVTAPPVPGIVSLCDTGLFQFLNRQRGNEAPQKPRPKTGAGTKNHHPSRSEGSIPDGSTRGILKGGTIRAGASCSPLKPASLHTFLPEQESMAPLASARSASGVNFAR